MQETILEFLKLNATNIVWIVVLFFLGKRLLKFITKKLTQMVDDGDDSFTSQKEQRAETLSQIIKSTGNIIIYSVILFMILNLFGVDIRPILASAGVVGLAIGFGAQSLVKDFISGLFILVENQYGINDEVEIGTLKGKVSRITMRTTVLKDGEGKTHYIPNGAITKVTNLSQ